MDISLTPVIPSGVTVHLGSPDSSAANVTVTFPEYVKNVASSEVYPTWEDEALKANILAIISFALNRIYTRYYPSRGYSFDITSSTAIDQKFVNGRSTFENIDLLTDDLFNSYIRRSGHVEPLAAKFCNGTTVTCEGLSQWGSQELAQQGYSALEILRFYYGDDIELVSNVPLGGYENDYPGQPLRQGDTGAAVVLVQGALNRIAQSYPAIPKIATLTGIFGQETEDAVLAFQGIFGLTKDGIVGAATWNKLSQLYVAVTKLGELVSEGQQFVGVSWEYPQTLSEGASGETVRLLQYMLSVVSQFVPTVPSVSEDGSFGTETAASVRALQGYAGLTQDGIVGPATWAALYEAYASIEEVVLHDEILFPSVTLIQAPDTSVVAVSAIQRQLRQAARAIPAMAAPRITGTADRQTAQAISAFQRAMGMRPTGRTDPQVRQALSRLEQQSRFNRTSRHTQYPGQPLHVGSRDEDGEFPIVSEADLLGQPVRSLQRMLRELAIREGQSLPLIPDGVYGQNTLAAVILFQQANGLPATGITDFATWQAIAARYRAILPVSTLTEAELNALAPLWGGPETGALKWLQSLAGLPAGPFGPQEQAAAEALRLGRAAAEDWFTDVS